MLSRVAWREIVMLRVDVVVAAAAPAPVADTIVAPVWTALPLDP